MRVAASIIPLACAARRSMAPRELSCKQGIQDRRIQRRLETDVCGKAVHPDNRRLLGFQPCQRHPDRCSGSERFHCGEVCRPARKVGNHNLRAQDAAAVRCRHRKRCFFRDARLCAGVIYQHSLPFPCIVRNAKQNGPLTLAFSGRRPLPAGPALLLMPVVNLGHYLAAAGGVPCTTVAATGTSGFAPSPRMMNAAQ